MKYYIFSELYYKKTCNLIFLKTGDFDIAHYLNY